MWRLGFWLMLLCVGAGCTFSRDWTKAGTYPVSTNDVTGRWIGHWRSDANGHHGQLRCILTQHSTNAYMARFRARFWKIFAAGYSVPLTLTATNGHYTFEGSAKLGALGCWAVYTYEGTVSPVAMESTYESKRDHGTFVLRRPQRGE
jgi:hypothetical protein